MRQPGRGGRCRPRSLGAWPGDTPGASRPLPVLAERAGTRAAATGVRPGRPDVCSRHPGTRSARPGLCSSSKTAQRRGHSGADACPSSARVTALRALQPGQAIRPSPRPNRAICVEGVHGAGACRFRNCPPVHPLPPAWRQWPRQSWRVSRNTGICRVVLARCSPTVGDCATSRTPSRPGALADPREAVRLWTEQLGRARSDGLESMLLGDFQRGASVAGGG